MLDYTGRKTCPRIKGEKGWKTGTKCKSEKRNARGSIMRLGTTLEREDYYLKVTQRLQSQEAREDAEGEQEEQDQTLGTIPSRRDTG